MLERLVDTALEGRGSHVPTETVFDGLDWRLAGRQPAGSPLTIWQLLNHMIYWQDFGLSLLHGVEPEAPPHASDSWPGGLAPESEQAWLDAVARFRTGLAESRREGQHDPEAPTVTRPDRTRAERLMSTASHNSYHAGQVALLRRMLGSWPPPGGGDTW